MRRFRELATATPGSRVRHIDALRAMAITAVVTGHWLVVAVEYDRAGRLTGLNALTVLDWSHPVTWLFQVMPVFFLVGGYANAASYQARLDRGGTAAGWLVDRSARLVRPTTVLLVVIAAAALSCRLAGLDPGQIATAAWLATLPLWFLAAYLAVVALTPVMYRLHRFAGLAAPPLLLLPVFAGDLARLFTDEQLWAYGNFLFGWLAVHQAGFCWRDRQLPVRPAGAAALLAGGLVMLVLLTYAGPYPVSMVSVPGQQLQNPAPPSLALLALACAQWGLALLLQPPVERWLRRTRPWTVVVAANAVILTAFLWHMAAVVIAAVTLHAAGALATPEVDSAGWLLWQLPWLAVLALILACLVAAFGPIEARAAGATGGKDRRPTPGSGTGPRRPVPQVAGPAGADRRPLPPVGLPATAVAGYGAVVGGLLWVATAGDRDHGPFALPSGALGLYLTGAAVLWLARRR